MTGEDDFRTPEIIAHRGYSAAAPENTLAAMDAALEAGADALEWDVHVAACGTAVLFHDDTLDRTTDAVGPLVRHTAEELRRLDAGGWFHPRFRGEPVPSLEETLLRVKGRVRRVYPEVKAYREPADLDRMVDTVRRTGTAAEVVFISMVWEALDRIQEAGLAVGYIVEEAGRFPAALERIRSAAGGLLDPDHRLLLEDPSWASEALEAGAELAVWTVDDPPVADRLLEIGVTRFTTNQVERLIRWRRRLRTRHA